MIRPSSASPFLASALVAVALAGCGGNQAAKPGTDQQTSQPREAVRAVTGTGYAFEVPARWTDATKRFAGSAVRVDRVFAGERVGGIATNVVVIRETPSGGVTLDAVMRNFRGQAQMLADDRGISTVEDRTLGGRPAKTYSYAVRGAQRPTRQRQVVAVVDRAVYTITFTAAENSFSDQEPTFDDMLASWRWR